MNWRDEFPADYAVPAEVEALVALGEADDCSWHNDSCPSFGRCDGDGGVRLWVDHPDSAMRDRGPGTRYFVLVEPSNEVPIETDDVGEAIEVYRRAVVKVTDRCYFCGGAWGACTCAFPSVLDDEGRLVDVPDEEGFDWCGMFVTEPNVSDCGRWFVNPVTYYGAAYVEWVRKRGREL